MYELSRVRLHSVGPKGARYQDVTLDLSGVGKPVAHPVQGSLLDPSNLALPRRPSPASVLFTENGSGKSVLMKLIFSVMLPGRRQVVGTTSSRVLENFVLDTDVAQVALEWQHTGTGERVVTGKVSAWRGHVVSTDPNRLTEAWYSFRPTSTLSLDGLPLTEQGRLVSLAGFRERLSEANKSDPGVQLIWEHNHGAWTEHLEGLELDPTLFVYQRRMNAGEGEAAEAFSFASDEAFVDWLLRSVTDEEDPRDLAAVVEGYASTLAARGALSAEREFIAGALERLTTLTEAARDHRAAAEQASAAGQRAITFGSAVRLRHRQEQARLDTLAEQATQLEQAEREADQEQRRLGALTLDLGRRVAGLKLAQAEAIRDGLVSERDAAKDQLAGWQATGTLLRFRQTQQIAESLRQFVGEKEADAAPILTERDRAAQRLIRGLIALATQADRLAQQASESAGALDVQIEESGREDREHALLAERRRGAALAAERQLERAAAAFDELVAGGLLNSGADLAAEATRTATRAEEVAAEVRRAEARQQALTGDRKSADRDLQQLEGAARDLEHEVRIAAERHERAVSDSKALAAHDRLAALLGADDVDLETDANALLTRLAEAGAEAEAEQTGLRMAGARDQQVIDALGTGGLLPPSGDVAAVCDALLGVGIACHPGWEYLAHLPDGERDRALRSYPQLVDGVVLNNPAHLDRARRVIHDARLLPRSVVAVGSTASFDQTDPAAGDLEFVVPPNPAMYDGELAETERRSLLMLQGERDARLAELERQIGLDRRLGDRVEQWLRDYPPGAMAALEAERLGSESAHRDDLEQLAAARARAATIATSEQDLAEALPQLREAAQEARRRAERLALVAAESAHVPQWSRDVQQATRDARQADATAAAARVEAERLRRVKEETIRRGDDQKRIAVGCRREIADIPGGGFEESGEVPAQPVETLRVAYRAACEAYSAVEVGQDLRAQLEAAEKTEAEARAAIEALKPAIRERAGRLLDTPDGADAPARAAATERADRAVAERDQQVSRAEGDVGGLRHGYEQLRAATAHGQSTALEPGPAPTDIADGERLIARAEADCALARGRFEEIQRRGVGLAAEVSATRTTVDGFESVALSTGEAPSGVSSGVSSGPAEPDVVPFAGTVEAARERARQVRAEQATAQTRLNELAALVRRCSSALPRYAADQRFERAESPVRQQILAIEVDALPTYADEWEAALRPRLRTLTDDLAHIGRHRSQITTRLRGLVTTALTVLQAAERVSVLPDTLGDWAGQKFLKIRFAEPDRAALDERLGQVIDEFAEANARADKAKRDGMTLLLRGVRAAMPKGVRVEMLKPDASERAERIRIAQVSDVFSGGQLLTAAIILYCTMAALRANERGQTRRPHAGVLFLDNPIGRASAGYLLELQLGVADALGVQLIYTTGLFDVNALSVFPLIVRLRNDRDLRSGMRFLTVDDEIRSSLDALGGSDGTGQLTAARLFRKPA